MTARLLATIGTATVALIAASPALAQPVLIEDAQRAYEYAQQGLPLPTPAPVPVLQPPVVFTEEPVVQPLPAHAAHDRYEDPGYDGVEHGDAYGEDNRHEVIERRVYRHGQPHHGGQQMGHHAGHYVGHGQMPAQPAFDRTAWLDECTSRYRSERRRGGDGDVIGGLVGAAAGGLIGNRIADGDRLAGTLIGAGVGGLAGLAVGSAIDHATNENRRDEALTYCEDWLARYQGGYGGGYGQAYGQTYGYGYPAGWQQGYYGYAQPVMMVQIMVPVEQHAVVREYVSYETVEETVVTYEPAPAPRQRYIKPTPVKRQRYIKN